MSAADEILAGELRDQFVVDVYQAGAGTSHNMNANEVLANRASEILGGRRGEYTRVHPNDHVNMGQSTNDVYPTATRLALLLMLPELLAQRARAGRGAGGEERGVRRACSRPGGRTCRTPCRSPLGQEFGGFAANVAHAADEVERRVGSSCAS